MGIPAFEDSRIVIVILISAGLYLFDFVTNILTAKEYHHLEYDITGIFPGIFEAILVIMIVAHLFNAIIFRCTLPPEDRPVYQAYFLPLIQLWRLGQLLWYTCTLEGIESLKSEAGPLYSIVAAALETGPQLVLLYYVFAYPVTKPRHLNRLKLSMLASLLSASGNGAIAAMSLVDKATHGARLAVAAATGTYIFASMMIRTVSISVLINENTGVPPFLVLIAFLCVDMAIIFCSSWFVLGGGGGDSRRVRLMRCAAYSYAGLTIGPLYPMLSEHERRRRRGGEDGVAVEAGGEVKLWLQLWIASVAHLLLDFMVLVLAIKKCGVFFFKYSFDISQVIYPTRKDSDTLLVLYMPRFFYGTMLYITALLAFITVDWVTEQAALKKEKVKEEDIMQKKENIILTNTSTNHLELCLQNKEIGESSSHKRHSSSFKHKAHRSDTC